MQTTFDAERLAERLAEIAAREGTARRLAVAFSGGLDSTALLHALSAGRGDLPIVAIHVDHGLHPDSRDWSARAAAFADGLGIDCRVVKADVARDPGGPEAAARAARYRAFRGLLKHGDWLLTAQHRDDQAETLLLHLLRGSGPLGLSGMRAVRTLGDGKLVRPLLDIGRRELADYVRRHELESSDDPSNADTRFDRNFMRREILPALSARWPAAARRIARSASLAGEAERLLDELAALDMERLGMADPDRDRDPSRLPVAGLMQLTPARQRNLLRAACRRLGLPRPPARRLDAVIDNVIAAGRSANPYVAWPGAEVRRHRETLFLGSALPPPPEPPGARLEPGRALALGAGLGSLSLSPVSQGGLRADLAAQGLELRFRRGGEVLKVHAGGHRRPLKALLREADVPPWMRERVPLLWSADRLVAVADLFVDADSVADDGYEVVWQDRPALGA